MSTTTSLRSPRHSRHTRTHWDDYRSPRNSRNTGFTASNSDNQSIFNVSIHSFHFVPLIRSPKLEGSNKEYSSAEITPVGTLEEIPCLFPATLAEKLCVAASHPELFSSEDFLDLVYGSISDGVPGSSRKKQACDSTTIQLTFERVYGDDHPLGCAKKSPTIDKSGTCIVEASPFPVFTSHRRNGVLPKDVAHVHHAERITLKERTVKEAYEMGNPRSKLQQANLVARTAGYANHPRVETGLEAQPIAMQFTKLTPDSYDRFNLVHEWFRSCCEYGRSLEVMFPSAAEGWLWEAAVQQQCNEVYYFYIHDHCSYGTCLPPRLDLRPIKTCPRAIRFEQYLVPQHEWSIPDEDDPQEEDLILIRGPFKSDCSPLRKQLHLGLYGHVEDPHQHILFASTNSTEEMERWRTRNLTEDGTLFRYSRRDAEPSLVEYDEIDHIELFQNNRCRRYFPRLRPNLYPRRR